MPNILQNAVVVY